MQKRKNKFLIIILLLLFVCGCNKTTDSEKFKKEFEKYNDEYTKLIVDKNNPFKYTNIDSVISMIDNKETFVLYSCSPKNNWCREIVEDVTYVAKEYGLNNIYYLNTDSINDWEYKQTVIGVIKGKIIEGKLLESEASVYEVLVTIIEEVSIDLNSCDINVGC